MSELIHLLSRITNGKLSIGVEDDLHDAALFQITLVPKWSYDIAISLSNGRPL